MSIISFRGHISRDGSWAYNGKCYPKFKVAEVPGVSEELLGAVSAYLKSTYPPDKHVYGIDFTFDNPVEQMWSTPIIEHTREALYFKLFNKFVLL